MVESIVHVHQMMSPAPTDGTQIVFLYHHKKKVKKPSFYSINTPYQTALAVFNSSLALLQPMHLEKFW